MLELWTAILSESSACDFPQPSVLGEPTLHWTKIRGRSPTIGRLIATSLKPRFWLAKAADDADISVINSGTCMGEQKSTWAPRAIRPDAQPMLTGKEVV